MEITSFRPGNQSDCLVHYPYYQHARESLLKQSKCRVKYPISYWHLLTTQKRVDILKRSLNELAMQLI